MNRKALEILALSVIEEHSRRGPRHAFLTVDMSERTLLALCDMTVLLPSGVNTGVVVKNKISRWDDMRELKPYKVGGELLLREALLAFPIIIKDRPFGKAYTVWLPILS